nr:MAG: hypothetical protein [Bacteriophage sp.]
MKFLDLNGLKHLLTKIKASFGTAIVESSQNSNIPFVANHQIVNVNSSGRINVYDWFQKASKGGILEVVFTGAQECLTYCSQADISVLLKMKETSKGPILTRIEFLETAYNTYARLIKINNVSLLVAEFVQNK